MHIKKEEGMKMLTMKFNVKKIKATMFNLLALIYETDLYNMWFPFCKKSFTVSILIS